MATENTNISGSWRLMSIAGHSMSASDNVPQFTIDGSTISGFDGCNQFGGNLNDPQSMRLGQRACAGDYVKLPLDLSDPKAHLDSGSLQGDSLTLPARAGLPSSVFVRE